MTVHGPARLQPHRQSTMCSGHLEWRPRDGTRLNDIMNALCRAIIDDVPFPTAGQIADSVGTTERAVTAAVDTLVKRLPISDDIFERLSHARAVAEVAFRSGLATHLSRTLSKSH